MKISNKISLSFMIAGIILTLLGTASIYAIARNNLKNEIIARLEATAQSREAHIKTYLHMLDIAVAQFSKSVILEMFLKTPKDAPEYSENFRLAIQRLTRTKAANPSIHEFVVCDETGRVVASSNKDSIGQDKSSDAFFVGGQKGVYIKDAYFSEALDRPLMAVSAPITEAATGKFIGVMAARVNMDELYRIVTDRTGLGNTGEIYIVNKYGYMITPSRFLEDTFLKKKVDTENYRQCALRYGKSCEDYAIVISEDYMGNMVVGTHTYIPRMQWSLLTEIDADEAFEPLANIARVSLITVALLALVFWLIGGVVSMAITGPIEKLRKGAEVIGEGNLDYKVGTSAGDEVGQLSRAFDTMTADLKKKTVSINDLNKEIAERKILENELAKSEEKFRELFESSKDAIMMLTPSRGFFDANSATIELFGCRDKKHFTSLGPADLSPARQPDGKLSTVKAQEMMAMAMDKGSHFFEWTHKRADGREFFATVLLTRMEIKGEKVLQATVRDITAEKRANEMIANAAKEWSTTFDSMAEGVSIHDPDFGVMNVNAALCAMLGKTKEELVGKKCYSIFHGKDAPLEGCPTEKSCSSGRKEYAEVFEPFVGRWLAVSVSPICDEKGKAVRFIHVISDITERKAAEAKVAEAMNIKAQFISTVSHELRTPLTAIKEGIGIVFDGSAGTLNDDQKEFLSLAKRNVDRLVRLINDVLDYQKLEAGRMAFYMHKADINPVAEEVIKAMLPIARSKGLSLEARLAPYLPEIIFDRDKIMQVLMNLVTNAVKFTAKGAVTVTTSMDNGLVEVSVKDTGMGIRKEDMPKLFQGFSQLGMAGPDNKGSTGLGLAISRQIIKGHNGEIWAESEYGKGSDFKFTLPVVRKS